MDLTGAEPSGGHNYYNNCLWKTQNLSVTGDTFSFDAAAVPGCTPTAASPCGENGIVSQVASGIWWSPYQTTASGNAVPDAITNCQGTNTFAGCIPPDNYFSTTPTPTPAARAGSSSIGSRATASKPERGCHTAKTPGASSRRGRYALPEAC